MSWTNLAYYGFKIHICFLKANSWRSSKYLIRQYSLGSALSICWLWHEKWEEALNFYVLILQGQGLWTTKSFVSFPFSLFCVCVCVYIRSRTSTLGEHNIPNSCMLHSGRMNCSWKGIHWFSPNRLEYRCNDLLHGRGI